MVVEFDVNFNAPTDEMDFYGVKFPYHREVQAAIDENRVKSLGFKPATCDHPYLKLIAEMKTDG